LALQSKADLRLLNGLLPGSCFSTYFQHKVLHDPNPLINLCNGAKDLTFIILIQIPYFSYSCNDEYHVGHTTDNMHSTFMSCAPPSYTLSISNTKSNVKNIRIHNVHETLLISYARRPSKFTDDMNVRTFIFATNSRHFWRTIYSMLITLESRSSACKPNSRTNGRPTHNTNLRAW
jgi:hypothetical protein